ncbi:MAG: hypothetical protein HY023_10400 [Chloroflexi bacterium]|nr:hypothetical protein [Chloroflexota bacterium]
MPVRVVVLSHRSLFAGGIASRLRERADLVDVQTVDASLPDALDQLRAVAPAFVVVDVADTAADRISIGQVLDLLPEARVIRIDPGSDHVQICSRVRRRARGVDELIEVMRQFDAD